MAILNGTKIRVTKLQLKDYMWVDDEFEKMSALINGQEGVIVDHYPELAEFGERESYEAVILCKDGSEQSIEIEEDEFIILDNNEQ